RAHPAALRARLLQREQPLRRRDHARAVAVRADDWGSARCGAGAVARVTCELELHGHGRLHALKRIFERDPHLDLDVVAALAALRLLPVAAAVEDAAEDVAEVEVAEVERRPGAGPRLAVHRAEAVVLLPLLRIGEHVVRALHLLEALLVARVAIRMHLADELAVGLLQ